MKYQILPSLLIMSALIAPTLAVADPPAHAPAHGRRAKHKESAPAPSQSGIKVVFDSERGVHVAVWLPDVFFHDGHYYRERDSRWEISLTGNGGWQISVASKVPSMIVTAGQKKNSRPGSAKKKMYGKHK